MNAFKDAKGFWIVLVTGLGYFSDSYDVFLYNVMRVPSLTELGLAGDALTKTGIWILNAQVSGALLGGFFWGLLGDKIGRKKALIGSVIVDSLAMLANGFVHDIHLYMVLRFLVGFGIAGEVGLGATLVAEYFPQRKRVFGLAVFTLFGLLGVAAAAASIEFLHWRTALIAGGMGGLCLLLLRARLAESALFVREKTHSFFQPLKVIFTSPKLIGRYMGCVAVLAPNYFITGLLLTLSPEIAKSLGIAVPIKANLVLCSYFSIALLGDLGGAGLTHILHSRRQALLIFLCGNACLAFYFLFGIDMRTAQSFYLVCGAFGLFNLWALASTVSVEQFPTALRATVATSSVNAARFSLLFMNLSFLALKPYGTVQAAAIVGMLVLGMALAAVVLMRETVHEKMAEISR